MRALAAAGHDHAVVLNKCADELEAALQKLDDVTNGTMNGATLRDVLRSQHRAKLTWWRATGEQLDSVS